MNYTSLCPPEPFGCKLSLPFDNGGNSEIGLHKGFVRLESSVQFGVLLVGTTRIFSHGSRRLWGFRNHLYKWKCLGFLFVSVGVRLLGYCFKAGVSYMVTMKGIYSYSLIVQPPKINNELNVPPTTISSR